MPQIANQDYNILSCDLADYPGYGLNAQELNMFVLYKAYKLGTFFDSITKTTQENGEVFYMSLHQFIVIEKPSGSIIFLFAGAELEIPQELQQRFDELMRWEQNRSNV